MTALIKMSECCAVIMKRFLFHQTLWRVLYHAHEGKDILGKVLLIMIQESNISAFLSLLPSPQV